ncbi:MAG: DUF262 domain-containing protein [Endomicrobium sp.]|jgi:hypothetical protein|nr:DUF262 domain-containing protein [Endomicrobium sp.]
MNIDPKQIPISEIVKNYVDNAEEGVFGYNGKLNIRPPYQREFIYKEKQRNAVIETIRKSFPLNVMYWVNNGDSFEVLDGQQRTVSICQYIKGEFSISEGNNILFFHNLTNEEQEKILNYNLMVYFCDGTDKEKLDWFKIINIAGEKLADQELRNAVYTGSWLADAKLKFSKTNCAAYLLGKDYLNGSPIRQEFLETAIQWISNDEIEDYMSKHQHKPNANELWLYFQNVINWVKVIFSNYRKEMKGVNWGNLYNQFKDKQFDSAFLEREVIKFMKDEDVTKKSGIYEYLLDGQEKHLNIRRFNDNIKREAYEKQKGICKNCKKHFDITEMEPDHITPWHEGGKTIVENCQMLCKDCNRRKSGK